MSTSFDTVRSGAIGVGRRVAGARRRFAAVRHGRPFWGGTVLALSGLTIGYIPIRIAAHFAFVPSSFAWVGIIFGVLVTLCGIFAVAKPRLAEFFGSVGMLTAIASIVGGSLGGFFLGTVLGIVGGAACIAWDPPGEE